MSALETAPTALDYALHYAARGWRVVPTAPGRKVPVMQAWQREGTTNTDRITHWWTKAPDNSISIVTGQASGIWVLDVDTDEGKHGDDTLADLEAEHGKLPDTWTVVTGSGGLHLYFAWPRDGRTIRNSASGVLGPGLDVRGEGGQVVAPPSVHKTGARYEREMSCTSEVADAPDWIVDLLTAAPVAAAREAHPAQGERPGDLWAAQTTWDDLLTPDGWTLHHADSDGEQHWTRPGKDRREGTSATVGYRGSDVLKVFTSSVAWLQAESTYTKLGYLAARDFDGDHSAAARHLASAGHRAEGPTLSNIVGNLPDGTALDEPWDTPEPIIAVPDAPAFPLHALPTWCVEHTEAVAEAIQVPVDLPATFAIGALSAALTGRATVDISGVWSEPTNLYLAVVMRSGAGKSPAEKAMVGWLRRWEAARIAEAQPERDKALMVAKNARRRADEAEKSAVMGSVPGGDDAAWDARLAAIEAENDVPTLPRLLIDDATPEAVATSLAAYDEHLAIMSTEADLFDMALGDGRRKPNINVYLKAWSGDSLIRDRKGSTESGPEMTKLEHPLLTVCCAAQPRVLDRISTDAELTGRGFVQRFMLSVPAHDFGGRDYSRRFADTGLATVHDYDTTCNRLAERWANFAGKAHITYSPDARRALARFMAEVEPQLATGARLAPIAEWVSKCFASVARYAAILHLAEGHAPGDPVDAATVERAIELGWYWVGHALVAQASAGDKLTQQATAILETIAENGWRTFTASDIQKHCRRPALDLVKAAEYGPPLQLLVDNSWLRTLEADGWADRLGTGKTSPTFTPWVGLHEMTWKSHLSRGLHVARIEREKSSLPIGGGEVGSARDVKSARQGTEPANPPIVAQPVDNPVAAWQPEADLFDPVTEAEVAAYDNKDGDSDH